MSNNGDDVPVPAGVGRNLVQQIWDRYVEGYSAHEISEQLSIALDRVDQLLMERHQERRDLRHQQPDFFRDADCARVDRLLQTYLPISLMDSVTIEKIKNGELSVSSRLITHCTAGSLFCSCSNTDANFWVCGLVSMKRR